MAQSRFHYSICSWATVLVIAAAMPLKASEPIPLTIVGKSLGAVSHRGQEPTVDIELTIRNDSNRVITAWRLTCMQAENDGNFASGSGEVDAFLALEDRDEAFEEAARKGPMRAGDQREVVFKRPLWKKVEPYAATSCGVEAVIFEDGSFMGVSSTAAGIFRRRETLANDVEEVLEHVRRMIDADLGPSEEPVEAQLSESNSYSDALKNAKLSLQAGDSERLLQIVAALEEHKAFIERHLPLHQDAGDDAEVDR